MKDNFKVVFLGDCGVGKSSLLTRQVTDKFFEFNEPTIGASYIRSKFNLENRNINLDIWDTAGQERYKGLVPMYYKNADCIILVYDISHKQTFINCTNRVNELKSCCPNALIFLIGNKCDIEEQRTVDKKLAEEYSKNNDLYFLETSAKTSKNVKELFKNISKELSEIIVLEENTETIINFNEKPIIDKKKCC